MPAGLRTCRPQHPDPRLTEGACPLCRHAVRDESYRRHWGEDEADWAKAAGIVPAPPKPRCPFLWRRARDESGAVKRAACVPCGGRPLDLFECRCPARRRPDGGNDQVTLKDCDACPHRPPGGTTVPDAPRALILHNHLSPGDVLCMTAAVHSLHKQHPGRFLTAVDTPCPALWENNPDVVSAERAREAGAETVQTHYPLVNECNQRAAHVLQGYCDFLQTALQVPVPLLTNKPVLYLSKEEKEWIGQVQEATGRPAKFWVVCAGRKADYTAKWWGAERYQRVVDLLAGKVQFVQVGAAEHHHPPLRGVLNLVGKTDLRQLVRLVWHAEGTLSGVTLLHHLGAALDKPGVTVMGGREPVQWNSYPKNHLLHTVGALSCCRDGGCWKSRVVRLNDGSEQDGSLCEQPTFGDDPVPRCQALITPEEVAAKILLCRT